MQGKAREEEKPKFEYPQSIFVKEEQYFHVPLGWYPKQFYIYFYARSTFNYQLATHYDWSFIINIYYVRSDPFNQIDRLQVDAEG